MHSAYKIRNSGSKKNQFQIKKTREYYIQAENPYFTNQLIEDQNLNQLAENQQIQEQAQNNLRNTQNIGKFQQENQGNGNKILKQKQNVIIKRFLQQNLQNIEEVNNEYHNTISDGSIYQSTLQNLKNEHMMSTQIYQEKNQNDVSSVSQIISSLRVNIEIQREKNGEKEVIA